MKHTIDARNLLCPMPVIRLQTQIGDYQAGDTIEIISTDPGTQYDIPAWCRVHGHKVLDIQQKENEIRIFVEVGQ